MSWAATKPRSPIGSKPHLEDCNQEFFDRVNVYELDDGGDVADADPGGPFDTLLDPSLHAASLTYEARLRAGEDVKPTGIAGLNIKTMVGDTRLELMTSTSSV